MIYILNLHGGMEHLTMTIIMVFKIVLISIEKKDGLKQVEGKRMVQDLQH